MPEPLPSGSFTMTMASWGRRERVREGRAGRQRVNRACSISNLIRKEYSQWASFLHMHTKVHMALARTDVLATIITRHGRRRRLDRAGAVRVIAFPAGQMKTCLGQRVWASEPGPGFALCLGWLVGFLLPSLRSTYMVIAVAKRVLTVLAPWLAWLPWVVRTGMVN